MDAPTTARERSPPFQRRCAAEQELIDEITNAARRIAEARDSNGEPLGEHELAMTTHVVRVIRQRLERDARGLARRKANPPKS